MIFHPRFKTLSRYASRELGGRKGARVAGHLADCTRCRRTVAQLRQLSEAAKQLPDPELPAAAWEAIVGRRERGDRVILPTVEPDTVSLSSSGKRYLMIAASALILVFGGLVLFNTVPEAEALKSELRFRPGQPLRGARIEVEYRPSPALAGEETLRLRARYRTPASESYNYGPVQTTVGTLVRGADGIFRASFQLPDSVVYAAFVVEALDANRVDHNHRRLWELVVREPNGRPLYDALVQKRNELIGRNWELAFETVRQMTSLYPERPDGWGSLASLERQVLGEAAAESLRTEHEARFQQFQRELKDRPNLSADQIRGMWGYGLTGGDREERRYWTDRLDREFPDHPLVIFRKENELRARYLDEPGGTDTYLAELEPLWEKIASWNSPAHGSIVYNAAVTARLASDARDFLRWVERYRSHGRGIISMLRYFASWLDRWPELRETKLSMLREALHLLEDVPDSYRALEHSVAEQRRENREEILKVLADLGATLVAAGDTAAGLDTLALAVSRGWSVQAFRTVAETQLAMGDTVAALRNLARIAADPLSDASLADSARLIGGPHFEPAQWESWVASGRLEMAERVLEGSIRRPLDMGPRLKNEQGSVRTLGELRGSGATVVLFWSRWCGPAVFAAPGINQISGWLQNRGVPLIAVVHEERSDELDAFLVEKDVSFPIFYDYRSEVKTAFNNFSTPEYYVLDESGWVVFTGSGSSALQRIPREVTALLDQAVAPTAPRDE